MRGGGSLTIGGRRVKEEPGLVVVKKEGIVTSPEEYDATTTDLEDGLAWSRD